MPRLIGCCFPYALYIPHITLLIHDGTRFRFLDPVYLYNISTQSRHVSFSIPRIRARKLQWIQ
jgi:hypothetical protein